MSASRLETVRRVAALRTAAARAAVGAAGLRSDLARRHHEERAAALAGVVFHGGAVAATHAELAGTARRASDVSDAGHERLLREDERRHAVLGWTQASRRARLLDDLCARHRAEREAADEVRTQHLLDDLAAGRKERTP